MGFLFGLIVLFFALVVVAALMAGLVFGVMFLLHRYGKELEKVGLKDLAAQPYGDFDFDHFQKGPFQELMVKLAGAVGGPIVLFPLLQYLLLGPFGLVRTNYVTVGFFLFLLVTAGVVCGFIYLVKLDVIRTIILSAAAAFFFLMIHWLYLYNLLSS